MSLQDTARGMADELTGAVVIGSLTQGVSPQERLDELTKADDGSWDSDYVQAASDEYHRREPDSETTPTEIASAVYDAVKDNLNGSF
jgi:hypothetical protein